MKKFFILFISVLLIFVITGCNDPVTEVIPRLVLNGPNEIIINIGETYQDLGANVEDAGDNSYPITISSTVDTAVAGSYIVTYSIEYNGNTISVSRTVIVQELNSQASSFNITHNIINTSLTTIEIEVIVTTNNINNLNATMFVYSGNIEIASYTISNGQNNITITNLIPDTEYLIEIEYGYDTPTGPVDDSNTLGTFSTLSDDDEVLETIDISYIKTSSTLNSITFTASVNSDDNITNQSVVFFLEQNNVIIEQIILNEGSNTIEFSNLVTGSNYQTYITYSYNFNGTIYSNTTTPKFFTIDSVATPSITVDSCESFDGIMYCYINENHTTTFTNLQYTIKLYLDNVLIEEQTESNISLLEFESLQSNATYHIDIYASYTIDNVFYDVMIESHDFTTPQQNQNMPEVSSYEFNVSADSILVDITISDPSYQLTEASIELLESGFFVESRMLFSGFNSNTFTTNITPLTTYVVKVIINYNDSTGNPVTNEVILEESVTTHSNISVISFNENNVQYNDTDTLVKITLDNPADTVISSITIDGTTYSEFELISDNFNLYVNLGTLAVGDYTITLDSITIALNDLESQVLEVDLDDSFTVYERPSNVPESATIEVVDLELDSPAVLIEENQSTTTKTLQIYLSNPYSLVITGITINDMYYNQASFSVISPNLIEIDLSFNYVISDTTCNSIQFQRNDQLITESQNGSNTIKTRGYHASEVTSITTASQFLNIPYGNGVYSIDNDIDVNFLQSELRGINNPFTGIILGNGHMVSNLSLNLTTYFDPNYPNETYAGWIAEIEDAVIYDLQFDNISVTLDNDAAMLLYSGLLFGTVEESVIEEISITNSSYTSPHFQIGMIGGIAGYSIYSNIENISVDAEFDVTFLESELSIGTEVSIGSIIGNAYFTNLSQIQSSSSISSYHVGVNMMKIGGLVANLGGSSSLTYGYFNGDISNLGNYTGGIVGTMPSTNTILRDTYSTGTIFGQRGYVGGVIGYSLSKIEDCLSLGNIYTGSGNIGHITGFKGSSVTIDNCYYIDSQELYYNGIITTYIYDQNIVGIQVVSLLQLETTEFYTDDLGYPEILYIFDYLNASNEEYPILK